MQILTDTLWNYLISGEYKQMFVSLFNSYFPFGLPFWLIAMAIFAAIHEKTKNLGFSGVVTSVYMLVISSTDLVVNAHAIMALKITGSLMMIISGYYMFRVAKG